MTEPINRRQQPQQQHDARPGQEVNRQSQAIARRKAQISGVGQIVMEESRSLDRLLPAHIPLAAFTSAAGAALYKSEKLMEGAISDPDAFLIALREAAMLGHLPGTDHYWLTPRKVKGRASVLGIEGYQGIVERMYRSGGTLSVHAEVVREADTFQPYAGPNARPLHEYGGKLGAFSKRAERGEVIGVYAYAILPGGVPSQLVLLSIEDLMEIKAANPFSGDKSSPWVQWPIPMMKKSALRRLEPYVPVSAAYREGIAAAQAFVASAAPAAMPVRMEDERASVAPEPDENGAVQEGEIVDDHPVTDVPFDPRQWGGPSDPGADDDPWAGMDVAAPPPDRTR